MTGPDAAGGAIGAGSVAASAPPEPLFWVGLALMAGSVVIEIVAAWTDRESGMTHLAVVGCGALGLILAIAGAGS